MDQHTGNGPADRHARRVTLGQLLGEETRTPAPTRMSGSRPLLPVRLGLGLACMALIVLGIGVSVRSGSVSGDEVSPAAVSTLAPAPVRPLKPNPRPYARPGWADPSADHLSYLPEGSGTGWFPAPAVEPAPDTLSDSAPLLTPPGTR